MCFSWKENFVKPVKEIAARYVQVLLLTLPLYLCRCGESPGVDQTDYRQAIPKGTRCCPCAGGCQRLFASLTLRKCTSSAGGSGHLLWLFPRLKVEGKMRVRCVTLFCAIVLGNISCISNSIFFFFNSAFLQTYIPHSPFVLPQQPFLYGSFAEPFHFPLVLLLLCVILAVFSII